MTVEMSLFHQPKSLCNPFVIRTPFRRLGTLLLASCRNRISFLVFVRLRTREMFTRFEHVRRITCVRNVGSGKIDTYRKTRSRGFESISFYRRKERYYTLVTTSKAFVVRAFHRVTFARVLPRRLVKTDRVGNYYCCAHDRSTRYPPRSTCRLAEVIRRIVQNQSRLGSKDSR